MSKKSKSNNSFGVTMLIVFAVYTVLVRFVDVDSIGPQDSEVGFSSINGFFMEKLSFSETWYSISKVCGLLALAVAGLFALMGLIQLISRRSIAKVDKNLVSLGVFYAAVGAAYVLFEFLIINYRPIIRDEGLEASYPSSHTMLAICILGTAVIWTKKLFRNDSLRKGVNAVLIMLMLLTIVSRFLSGVHWFTDIVGGVILSVGMVNVYKDVFCSIEREQKKKKLRVRSERAQGL